MTSKRDSECFVLALAHTSASTRLPCLAYIKHSIIDLLQNSIRIEIYSGIARFSLRYHRQSSTGVTLYVQSNCVDFSEHGETTITTESETYFCSSSAVRDISVTVIKTW